MRQASGGGSEAAAAAAARRRAGRAAKSMGLGVPGIEVSFNWRECRSPAVWRRATDRPLGQAGVLDLSRCGPPPSPQANGMILTACGARAVTNFRNPLCHAAEPAVPGRRAGRALFLSRSPLSPMAWHAKKKISDKENDQ